MKIKVLKKILLSVITVATIFAVNPVTAHAEWKKDSKGWWYASGNSFYKGWKQIDGRWYYFDSNGYMVHDRYVNNYYLNSKGYWDASVEAFSVKYPSNWAKYTDASGRTLYYLDDKGTCVTLVRGTIQGQFNKDYIDAAVKKIKSDLGIDKVDISQQVINGKTVDVFDYKFKDSRINSMIQIHQVIFHNNNQMYVFSIGGVESISSENMNSFNEMLKTVEFK